jgi:hypothetical protein
MFSLLLLFFHELADGATEELQSMRRHSPVMVICADAAMKSAHDLIQEGWP